MYVPSVPESSRWLGETVGFWIQTLILAVSAGAALWIIKANTKQERRRATVDLVMDQKRDVALRAARSIVTKMHEQQESNLAKYLEDTESEQYKAILLVLNMHEFVASGIREGAFDEYIYKRLRYATLIKDWEILCAFVMEFRRAHSISSLFQEFQWLSDRWRKDPLKTDRGIGLSI